MKTAAQTPRPRRDRGFSLVEITLALGIAATALVTAVGLLGVSLNSQSLSAEDTTLVSISEGVLSGLRSADFDTLWDAVPGAATATTKPAKPGEPPADSVFYFSQEGAPVEETDPLAYYECVVRKTPDPLTQSPDPVTQAPGLGRYNLVLLDLEFSSPKSIPANRRPNRRSLHANLARY